MDAPRPRGIVVFGGGTATNSLVDVFERIRESRGCQLTYVIPISDNGGSSSELIRVLGGPGIGDIRSRLVRLIPAAESDGERAAIRALFNHRLSADPARARLQWLDVVEGRDPLWAAVASEKRELVRSVFNHVNLEIVKRARPSSVFNFARASIGNLFLTGARIFTGSLESAIYLLSIICGIPPTVSTLPAINTNFTHHICAGLVDGTQITGQNAISHPSAPTALPENGNGAAAGAIADGVASSASSRRSETEEHDRIEDATLPGSLPTLRKQYIEFHKGGGGAPSAPGPGTDNSSSNSAPDEPSGSSTSGGGGGDEDLPSRIARIWYINPYGHEIWPLANPKVLAAVAGAGAVVYSIGSLYTSIVPSLVLRGVGAALARPGGPRYKVLVLNARADRETGPRGAALTAADFVRTVARAAAQSRGGEGGDDADAGQADARRYVTHLVYLEGPGAPRVDRAELAALGVECVRAYGRRNAADGMLRYDEAGLARALEAVIGRPEASRSRRNTSGQ
ncbi:UPF0052-domain-containing protein [Durotheca rogersii]|uniref:UPF0052-domain-containing protein n=1 Tax=Durotheca rogersii TaxID=419775 RepID=UPI00221FA51F|nr:UPF0052-domain-containing protein [Durotheca rogersii]KAI5861537.1 UPF0052-domain-containing protein [Durotheca rogersii]